MKKFYLLLIAIACLCSVKVFAASPCDREMGMTPKKPACTRPCEVTPPMPCSSENFLCTGKNMNAIFRCIGLSETQICTATKIQDKYEQEVLSLNESIQCEEGKLAQLKKTCATNWDIRKQKNVIKKLKKERKKICKCYEKQFKAILSDMQISRYKKAIKK